MMCPQIGDVRSHTGVMGRDPAWSRACSRPAARTSTGRRQPSFAPTVYSKLPLPVPPPADTDSTHSPGETDQGQPSAVSTSIR